MCGGPGEDNGSPPEHMSACWSGDGQGVKNACLTWPGEDGVITAECTVEPRRACSATDHMNAIWRGEDRRTASPTHEGTPNHRSVIWHGNVKGTVCRLTEHRRMTMSLVRPNENGESAPEHRSAL